ncbi:HlyD family secretion protein (plasmid) [Enterobacter sp. JS8-1]|uniref:HlyD family secretion protein n=1 Tax=Enterobacter sp. JS8-1 TaxID=3411633 RepID=UPI003BA0BE14
MFFSSLKFKLQIILMCSLFSVLIVACDNKSESLIQGYVEGDFMYISSSGQGVLNILDVKKGDEVQLGALLFALENESETQQLLQAQHQFNTEQATLTDLRSGRRKTELDVLRAQLRGAVAAKELANSKLIRNEKQVASGAVSTFDLETYRADFHQKAAVVEELKNRLSAEELPARDAQQQAQTARAKAALAVLNRSRWILDQMTRYAPRRARVFDTFYQPGEWVPAGSPVVSLLAPGKLKIRFFVSAAQLSQVKTGKTIRIILQPNSAPLAATIDYISPEAEYTPPIIYSNERKDKLVFLVEAKTEQSHADDLHPGMPVSVVLPL